MTSVEPFEVSADVRWLCQEQGSCVPNVLLVTAGRGQLLCLIETNPAESGTLHYANLLPGKKCFINTRSLRVLA